MNGYCREMGYTHVDAVRFVNYYAAKAGKSAMTKIEDWKALVRNWERQDIDQRQGMAAKDPQTAQKKSANRFANFEQLSMTMIQCFSGNGRKKRRSEKMEDVENTRRTGRNGSFGESYFLERES